MVKVIYWSQSGNTQAMAEAVAAGAGVPATFVTDATAADVEAASAVALGCPAMGSEVLEECDMEPFVCDIEGSVSGKTLLLFGSYGWGDGQWMRDWVDRMTAAGATVIGGEDAICMDAADDDMLAKLEAYGKQLASL